MIPLCVILDTNVCLDLFVFRDPACIKLQKALTSGVVKAVTNEACRAEWLRVLDYAQLELDTNEKIKCIAEFDSVVRCTHPHPFSQIILPQCSDPDDQKFLELARDSNADFLLTKDKALLKLAAKTKRAELFSILRPDTFIRSSLSSYCAE